MKILIFTTQLYRVGGYERLAIELAIELNRQGVRADVLSQYNPDISGVSETESILRHAGVQSVYYLGLGLNPSITQICRAALRLRMLIIKEGYSAIEISGFAPSVIAPMALFGMKTKLLVGIHNVYTREKYSSLRYLFFRKLLQCKRRLSFFAISQAVAQAWRNYLPVEQKKVPIILNSINNIYFSQGSMSSGISLNIRKEIGASGSARCILFVGRLLKSKGIDTIYDALKKHLVSLNCHLIFVGRVDNTEGLNSEEIVVNIRSETVQSPWSNRVHFLGVRDNVPEIMAACDVLVHPAHIEGFGLVLAEALAVGLPIIASNVGGIPEVLANTDSVMISPDDPNTLTAAVFELLSWSPEKKTTVSIKGKQRAELFRVENRASAILELLKN